MSDHNIKPDLAAMLVDMIEPTIPESLSPIKSPAKRSASTLDSDDDIPSAQPPPAKKAKHVEKTELNRLSYLKTRTAKASKSLSYLKEYRSKKTCPVGLQYRPKPHIRQDKAFQKAMYAICIEAEQKLLDLMIKQHETNLEEDSKAIEQLQSHLPTNNKAVKSAYHRSEARFKKSKPANTKKTDTVNMANINTKFNELKALLDKIQTCKNNENKTKDEFYSNVCFIDSHKAPIRATRNKTRFLRRRKKAKFHKNESFIKQYIKNFSQKDLSNNELSLLSKGLKFIPMPPQPASHFPLLRDFKAFSRTMRLNYMFAKSESTKHPFYVKSSWQPPPQPSVALETYLELTKTELANVVFTQQNDNLSSGERASLKALKSNKDIIVKKADKGTTTVIYDTTKKIQEGTDQLLDTKFYRPLAKPIVEDTANKVRVLVNKLRFHGFIDSTTHKWLSLTQKPTRIPEFYTLTKIHKKIPVGRPIVSGSGGPTERISSFVDYLLQPIAKKQESYVKDTTNFINFIEKTTIPDYAILSTFDVCSLYTNIPQEEGIEVVCLHYEKHYEPELPIPTHYLKELMRLILKENSFKFNNKHYLQIHGIAMGTKMAVAFSVIFMAHLETALLKHSPYKPLVWKRFIDDIFTVWTLPESDISKFLEFANKFHQTIKFTYEISPKSVTFLDTTVYKGPRFPNTGILDVKTYYKPTETFQYTHFSSCHPISVKKGFVKGETLRLLRNNSVPENFENDKHLFAERLYNRGYPKMFVTKILKEVSFTGRQEALKTNKRTSKRKLLPFITTYNPAVPNIKSILMKHWHIISNNQNLCRIYPDPPTVSYKRNKSLKDSLVRATIPKRD